MKITHCYVFLITRKDLIKELLQFNEILVRQHDNIIFFLYRI